MMELVSTNYVRFILALGLVLGLIALSAWMARRFRLGFIPGAANGSARLQVVESLALDARRHLVIIRRDDQEHLLLIGPETEHLIETGIKDPDGRQRPTVPANSGAAA